MADTQVQVSDSLNSIIEKTGSDSALNPKRNGLIHHPHGLDDCGNPPTASPRQESERNRCNSTVSHVDVDFFDPSGMQELRRAMTTQEEKTNGGATVRDRRRRFSHSSDATLTVFDDQPFNFEGALHLAVRKFEEAQIKPRSLGIVFRNLHVVGVGVSDSYISTLGSFLNPLHLLERLQKLRHPALRNILVGFEGVVKPREMILVLGRPGSGCSTLLKILANHRHEYYAIYGDVHYDSLNPEDIRKHFRGDVQYCPEDDVHFPTLTVDQTLRFAATTRTPRNRFIATRDAFAIGVTKILETIFGLRHAQNVPVGDTVTRGVSGGEKKRVSIAEALAARSCIGAWDNSTRGLDSSTALEFVRALRLATDVFEYSTIVSIYQASESIYQYFDKVCVIYEGRMAYFGPADEARQYFVDMGYEPANRQTTADFLVAVTDSSARIPRGFSNRPHTSEEFARHFLESELCKRNREQIEDYLSTHVGQSEKKTSYMQSAHAEFDKRSAKTGPYVLNIFQQIKAVVRRRVQILKGNLLVTGLNIFTFIFQGLIMGSLFLNSPKTTSAFFSRGGVLFFALLFSTISTMAEIPALYSQRPIVLRHEKAGFYHPFIESAAMTIVDIPVTIVTSVSFSLILYFMVGLQKTADQFFVFLVLLFITSLTMKSWFRGIAAAFSSEATAQTFAGISILAFGIYTGFSIPEPSMIGALRWITYINPLKYGFEILITNEFRTLKGQCSTLVPHGPGYDDISLDNKVCVTVGALPGKAFVEGNRFVELSYGFSWSHTWMNFGIIIAFGVAFTAALLIFAEYNISPPANASVTRFKRGSKRYPAKSEPVDAEHGPLPLADKTPVSPGIQKEAAAPPMVDVFSWKHIEYTIPVPGMPDRKLLCDVSGFVSPGKLTALMGESGAGKTTLLNVLAQRTDTGVITGDRFVNGQPLPADFQSQSGYCQQMDTHVPSSTVREALLFSAKLRQPASVRLVEKEAYVEKCLEMCGLEAYADASIGSLSIEHRKRTTIAVELAAKPKLLLFLDEPTSGLDSQSAWAIILFLRGLAEKGQAILCTIHQPSAELFQVFDRLLLLKKGGQTVYFGDIGTNATTLINYFERNGARPCLPQENPAEYMLDVIGAGATASSSHDWYNIWQSAPESNRVHQEIDMIHIDGRNRPVVETSIQSEFATRWLYQVKELFKRDMEAHWRDPTYLVAKLSMNSVGGLFIGFTFFNSPDTQQGIQNKLFAVFMSTILCVPLAGQLQAAFIDMRNIYEIRERSSRMYSWTALVTSQILAEIPWNIVGSSLLFFTWYWPVGFPASRAGYTFLMMAVVLPLYYTTFGQAVAAMSPRTEIATILFSLFFSFVIIFNGVLQPYHQLGWWKWMYYLSPFKYLIDGLLGQAIGRQEVHCSPIEFVTIHPPSGSTCEEYMSNYIRFAGGYLTNPSASSSCNFCSVLSTDQFLKNAFNISYDNRWMNFGVLMGFFVFNVFCIYLLTYLFRIRVRQGRLIRLAKFWSRNKDN